MLRERKPAMAKAPERVTIALDTEAAKLFREMREDLEYLKAS